MSILVDNPVVSKSTIQTIAVKDEEPAWKSYENGMHGNRF